MSLIVWISFHSEEASSLLLTPFCGTTSFFFPSLLTLLLYFPILLFYVIRRRNLMYSIVYHSFALFLVSLALTLHIPFHPIYVFASPHFPPKVSDLRTPKRCLRFPVGLQELQPACFFVLRFVSEPQSRPLLCAMEASTVQILFLLAVAHSAHIVRIFFFFFSLRSSEGDTTGSPPPRSE